MPRKLPDSRPKTLWQRLTVRHEGGKGAANGGRTPTTQDTGRGFGRGGQRRHKPLRPMGKGV